LTQAPGSFAREGPVESFRCSFWLFFAVILGFGLFVSLALIAFLWGWRIDPLAVVAGIAAGEAVGLLYTLAVVFYFKVYVGPVGLRCYNFWGVYRTAAWDDIRSARPFNFLGLRFLRAHTADARTPLWVPLFLTEPERFEALVRRYAGVTNPLARALEDDGTPTT
jgi:hypothetical protein